LRQGWLAGFADVETMPAEDLTAALEGRGFATRGSDLPAVDALLPMPSETDARWRVRRAATEVAAERGLWLVRYEGLVMPETEPGAPVDAAGALSSLTALLQDKPDDQLVPRLREAEARGRSGVVVTRLETAVDGSRVEVEINLWARSGPRRWAPVLARRASARVDEVRPGAADRLAADAQVRAAFGLIDALGLGGAAGEEARRRALKAGRGHPDGAEPGPNGLRFRVGGPGPARLPRPDPR
jgi:hypothetical protein